MLYLRIMTIKAKGKIVLTIKKITIMKTILYTIQNFAKRVVMVLTAILMVNPTWGNVVFDLTSSTQITSQSESSVVFTNGSATLTITRGKNAQGQDATRVNNYMPNGATDATHTRVYQYNPITLDIGSGQIAAVIVQVTSSSGSIGNITGGSWSPTAASTSGSSPTITYTLSSASQIVTITPSGGSRLETVTLVPVSSGYAITWAANGHGDVSGLASSGTSITLPDISVTGYTNTGWKANVAVTNTSTSASISANTFIATGTGVTLSGATTFTAQWETATYTVSYNKGTYGTGTNTSATKTHGVALTLLGTTFTRDGYTQQGWASDEAGTTKVYNLSASYTDNAAITLYPYWEKRPLTNYRTSCCTSYVITLADAGEVDGGTFNSNVARSCAEKTVTLSSSLCGYSQGEWTVTKTSDASTVVAVNNNTFVMPAYAVTVSLTTSENTDHFIDKMHRTTNYTGTGRALSGCGYTVPKLNNKSQGDGCEGEHFKFVGWAAEVDVNMSDGTLIGTPTLLEGNSTNNATGTTYYAIWQKETTE